MPKRWWIRNNAPNDRVIRRAFEWLDRVTPSGTPATLVVETKAWLSGGDIEDYLGERAVKLLTGGERVLLPRGGRLEIISMHGNRGRVRFAGPVLVVYCEQKLLDFVDRIEGVTEILVVPWTNADVEDWVRQWGAAELGTGAPQLAPSMPIELVHHRVL